MTNNIKSLVLAACMIIAAGAIAGTASAEDQSDGLNPCEMGSNPCDEQSGQDSGANPCDPQGGEADNPCAPQADDSYMDDGSAPQESDPESQVQ
ncbi:hypothetical protein [Mariprofundus ferrooxydans]|uniref:Uncharacterized protein n=1 Tax=Mariprofundus ferrooxydans PV-1 TaxID=314345 RepID=Q0F004_9PROT|nr:hypothetical protein [Mariprofundus ferrooxydans]EAU54880.1 hypothetical protein SPV1_09303 [Mariprofundus ferrooxydans PV-1]KON46808.1 hypothetical protein AL013_11380 [Mariprofundus ferrooxydans]